MIDYTHLSPSRRTFLKNMVVQGVALPFAMSHLNSCVADVDDEKLDIHVFSKHLQFLNFRDLGEATAEMGFDGVDLTVRPKGHVLPTNVTELLPRAIQEIQEGGSTCKMITTNVAKVENSLDRDILNTASQLGVQYYRPSYYAYHESTPMQESLSIWNSEVQKLADLNQSLNITACYQNHAGTKIGASYWELEQLLNGVDPQHYGLQYDIRHGVVEGGLSWENGLKLLHKQIRTIVLKDFKWGKVKGKWKVINVPIGEGMVDFSRYFTLLKRYKVKVPISLHVEYPLGGAESGKKEITVSHKVVFDAMKKDLKAIQNYWEKSED